MKILHHNATLFLLEKIHSIRYFHNSWRCIHLQLCGKKERYNRTMRTYFIIKGISELLAPEDGFVYLCDDGDIIILFEGRALPIIKKLATYFGDLDPRYADERFSNFFTTYDLSKDWAAFSGMCYLKSLDSEGWFRSFKNPLAWQFPLEEAPIL